MIHTQKATTHASSLLTRDPTEETRSGSRDAHEFCLHLHRTLLFVVIAIRQEGGDFDDVAIFVAPFVAVIRRVSGEKLRPLA